MFVGGMAGSTGGGIKVVRLVALLKTVRNELKKLIFPKAIFKVRMSKSAMTEQSLESVQTFFILYITVFGLGSVLLGLTTYFGGIHVSIETILSSVVSALNNIGPALDQAGPFDTYNFYDEYSKILLAFIMLVGRLEMFPIVILLNKKTWK
jgi:trk system potassium uptake protein TrkH